MTLRIQLRKDTSTNWVLNNPILLSGELGIETDTLKFKIGNGSRWNSTTSYALKVGEANGIATLNSAGKIPTSQLPDSISAGIDLNAAIAALTTNSISEGSTNKYFTNQRAIDAVSSAISSAISTEITNRNTAISTAKAEAITTASNDATNKAATAKSEAIAAAGAAADTKDTISAASAVTTANIYTDNKITTEVSNRNNAINTAISTEITNRNIAIANATPSSFSFTGHTTNELSEGSTNLYFTNARALAATTSAYDAAGAASSAQANAATDATTKANAAQTAAISAAATDATTKANAAQTAAISAAATDATTKSDAARVAAISAAATDATTKANTSLVSSKTYADSLLASVSNTLNDYVLESDRNQPSGFAGLNSSGKLLDSVIPYSVNNYVDTKIAQIVNSAPSTLDTLGELAAALQADESASTTLTTLVGTKLNSTTAATTYETITNVALKAPLASPTFTGTVSGITKSMVGLGNVDNTADTAKPISTATQTALDAKLASTTAASTYAPIASPTFTGTVSGVTKAMVGLGSVDNTSDTGKPVSTAQQTALDLKAPLASPTFTGTVTLPTGTVTSAMILDGTIVDADINASAAIAQSKISGLSTSLGLKADLASPTFTGTVSGITKAMVGLGNVDNTADTAKPISTATQTALDAKLNRLVSTNTQSASYSIAVTDAFKLIEMSGGGTLTIVDSGSFAIGTTIEILQTTSNQVTVAGSGFTPDSTPGLKLRSQWSSATLLKRGTNSWVVMGDLSA